jgi:hypothetical protein
MGNYPRPGFGLYLNEQITRNRGGGAAMLSYDEQEMFETTRQYVADALSDLAENSIHPALICAAILSEVSFVITRKDFWGGQRPDRLDFQGYWNITWRLQEKAFAELAPQRKVSDEPC